VGWVSGGGEGELGEIARIKLRESAHSEWSEQEIHSDQ